MNGREVGLAMLAVAIAVFFIGGIEYVLAAVMIWLGTAVVVRLAFR